MAHHIVLPPPVPQAAPDSRPLPHVPRYRGRTGHVHGRQDAPPAPQERGIHGARGYGRRSYRARIAHSHIAVHVPRELSRAALVRLSRLLPPVPLHTAPVPAPVLPQRAAAQPDLPTGTVPFSSPIRLPSELPSPGPLATSLPCLTPLPATAAQRDARPVPPADRLGHLPPPSPGPSEQVERNRPPAVPGAYTASPPVRRAPAAPPAHPNLINANHGEGSGRCDLDQLPTL
ncbi:hypothetical protein CALVIDRAFT_307139 [Calocera viscosa TUFC12733]|uniref:Uncharacterized protein n=1 Tax=Calocera viscosa (strain TUFC12733) TaxID=1330018 RepID=A0A167IBJ7_CALVF|nr:hypothetical protein CALVIDRAFT_307139 [Calocera viscosa TUFC12733]